MMEQPVDASAPMRLLVGELGIMVKHRKVIDVYQYRFILILTATGASPGGENMHNSEIWVKYYKLSNFFQT